jgi:hypothetical protein
MAKSKLRLIAEEGRDIFERRRIELRSIAIVRHRQKVAGQIGIEVIDTCPPPPGDMPAFASVLEVGDRIRTIGRSFYKIGPLLNVVWISTQQLPAHSAAGPAILIVDPELHPDRFRVQDRARQHRHVLRPQIWRHAREESRMKNGAVETECAHLVDLRTQLTLFRRTIDGPKRVKSGDH